MSVDTAAEERRAQRRKARAQAEPATAKRPRRRPHRPRSWRWPVIAGGLLVLAAVAVWLVFYSSVFGVSTVRVTGTKTLSAALVREIAAVSPSEPLARLDASAVAARVRTIPQVRSAEVSRSWPSTVRITVTERTPLAVVQFDGASWLVDAAGVRYDQVTQAPAGIPPLTAPDEASLRAALTVLSSLRPAFRATVAQVAAQSPDSVVLTLADGRTVIWGGADDSAQKAAALVALLDQDGTTFDVSSPAAVVIR